LPAIDPALAAAVCIVFAAAVVRGYSGFGFSLLTITALSLIYPPQQILPVIFMMELAASIHMLPGIWRDIHWRSLAPLIAGCAVATPLGVWLLVNVPAAPMQLAMSVFVLVAVLLMACGFALKSMPGTAASALAGAASGLANGAFGIGGPPVILFYFASPAGHAAGRASLIAFFLATDIIGLASQGPHGLITRKALLMATILLPPLIAGVWLGSRAFKGSNPEAFKKWVLAILAVLAVILGLKAFFT